MTKYKNVIYSHETGDGFRSLMLPEIPNSKTLVICSVVYCDLYYENAVNKTTPQKMVRNFDSFNFALFDTILLDIRIPRVGSKLYECLLSACKDKKLLIVGLPYDFESVGVLATLLQNTNRGTKVHKHSNHVFTLKGKQIGGCDE